MSEAISNPSARIAEPKPIKTKGKCWCCWETDETNSNPLIRVCRGCKDPDLQWIHQNCIDKYLSKLPLPRPPPQAQPPLDGGGGGGGDNRNQNNRRRSAWLWVQPAVDPRRQQRRGAAENASKEMESHFRCTRCRDTYLVLETPTPLITSIWQDKYLSFAVTLLLGSTSFVLFALLYCLYQEQWVVGQKLRLAVPLPWGVFGGQFLLDVTLFAGSMLAICYFMCWCMWCLLKDFFRGEVTRHVKEVEILAEEKIKGE